jgi:hypothetical protein
MDITRIRHVRQSLLLSEFIRQTLTEKVSRPAMKVDLYIAKRATFRFNIAIAELFAMKRNRPLPDAMLVL